MGSIWSDGESSSGKLAQANLALRVTGVVEEYVHCELSNAYHIVVRGIGPEGYRGRVLTAMAWDQEIPVGSVVEMVGVIVQVPGMSQVTTIVRRLGDRVLKPEEYPVARSSVSGSDAREFLNKLLGEDLL